MDRSTRKVLADLSLRRLSFWKVGAQLRNRSSNPKHFKLKPHKHHQTKLPPHPDGEKSQYSQTPRYQTYKSWHPHFILKLSADITRSRSLSIQAGTLKSQHLCISYDSLRFRAKINSLVDTGSSDSDPQPTRWRSIISPA